MIKPLTSPTMILIARYCRRIAKVTGSKASGWTVTLEPCGHTFHRTGARTKLGGQAYCADCRKKAGE